MLKVIDFVVVCGGIVVFEGVIFKVVKGQVVILCGDNGLGKIILLCMIVGL